MQKINKNHCYHNKYYVNNITTNTNFNTTNLIMIAIAINERDHLTNTTTQLIKQINQLIFHMQPIKCCIFDFLKKVCNKSIPIYQSTFLKNNKIIMEKLN